MGKQRSLQPPLGCCTPPHTPRTHTFAFTMGKGTGSGGKKKRRSHSSSKSGSGSGSGSGSSSRGNRGNNKPGMAAEMKREVQDTCCRQCKYKFRRQTNECCRDCVIL